MSIFVVKADGTKQLFSREKVVNTCIRMGASREIADEVAEKVELRAYDGIETGKILMMIFQLLSQYRSAVRHVISLRESLSLLEPKPDFERFIQNLLSEHGYDVTPNQIVRGRCVEHEVDAVARKNGETLIVEVKHHFNFHARTGLDESRIIWAVLEDVNEGYELGLNTRKIDRSMIVTNTKFSEEAKTYGKCKGIYQIGWSFPPYRGLEHLIEEKKLYPITYLKGLKTGDRERLASSGIILLKQLLETSPEETHKTTGIPMETVKLLTEKAESILSGA